MKHGKMLRRLTALALSAAMAVSTAFASVSVDKTATNLDSNDQTEVSLSIGAGQDKAFSDVVFVLDKSTSVDVRKEAKAMVEELLTRTGDNKIKVGVIVFNKSVYEELPLTELNETSYADICASLDATPESGTNIYAGLLAGYQMLADDDTVAANSKHLVLVTDGVTYLWGNGRSEDQILSIYSEQSGTSEESLNAGNEMWNNHHPDSSYLKEFKEMDSWLTDHSSYANDIESFEHVYIGGQVQPEVKGQGTNSTYAGFEEGDYIPGEDLENHASANDAAVYMAATQWKEIVGAGYHAYAYASPKYETTYPWGATWVSNLSTIGGTSGMIPTDTKGMFDNVKSEILFEIQKGTITDIIGDNFDWVGMDTVELTVGSQTFRGDATGDENVVTFNNGNYVLTYYANGIEGDSREQILLEIRVPVKAEDGLKLTYSLKISDKTPGTYPTNEEATLTYTSTDGEPDSVDFPKPEITIGGGNPGGGDDNDKPSGGGDNDRYEGPDLTVVKVDEDGETIESNARFRIYKEQGSKTMWYKGNQSWSEDEEDAWIFNTSVGDSSFTAYDLKPGTYYIVEISAPEGYDLAEEPLEVEVESRDVTVEFVNSGDGVVTTPTKPVPDTGR